MIALKRGNGSKLLLGSEIARGGEGTIYAIVGAPQHVAKIFHKPSHEKDLKLRAMLANRPRDHTLQRGHVSIAWPIDRILNQDDQCIGFTMPYIDRQNSIPPLKLYNPRNRREIYLNFTWKYLLRMAKNLAIMIADLHKRGYVVGDLNESNILVTGTTLVTLVDCDSMQVPKKFGQAKKSPAYFRCSVGKPEYTPPELQGKDFSQVDRTFNHDNFGLAVLFFLMLMEGRHPFASTWPGDGPPPTLAQNIQANNFPYVGSGKLRRPKNALPLEILPPDVQKLMIQCFAPQYNITIFSLAKKPKNFIQKTIWKITNRSTQPEPLEERPSAYKWAQTFEDAEKELKQCSKHPKMHFYSKHLKDKCPWCARMEQGFPDPFLEVGGAQLPVG